jgi:hypothetical protein
MQRSANSRQVKTNGFHDLVSTVLNLSRHLVAAEGGVRGFASEGEGEREQGAIRK